MLSGETLVQHFARLNCAEFRDFVNCICRVRWHPRMHIIMTICLWMPRKLFHYPQNNWFDEENTMGGRNYCLSVWFLQSRGLLIVEDNLMRWNYFMEMKQKVELGLTTFHMKHSCPRMEWSRIHVAHCSQEKSWIYSFLPMLPRILIYHTSRTNWPTSDCKGIIICCVSLLQISGAET